MLNYLKIGPKLIGSYTFVGIISVTIAFIGMSSMSKMDNADGNLYGSATVPMGDLVEISSGFQQSEMMLRDIVRATDTNMINSLYAKLNDLSLAIGKKCENVAKTIVTEEEKKAYNEFTNSRTGYIQYVKNIIALSKKRKTSEAYALIDGPAAIVADAEQNAIGKLVDLKVAIAKKMADENVTLAKKSSSRMIVIMVIALVIMLITVFSMVRSLTVPLEKLTQIANNVAEGKIDEKIEYKSRDEIGQLADSFRLMIGNFKGMIQETQAVLQAAGKGDLDKRSDSDKFKGVYRQLLADINTLMDSISKPLHEVLHSLECLSNNDTTEKITGQYSGIWDTVKTTVNSTIQRIEEIIRIVDKTSNGDLSELDTLKKIGKMSENDELIPAFIRMMEVIDTISNDIKILTQAAIEGRLEVRNDPSKYNGGYRKIVENLNENLDSILVPMHETMKILEKVANRDLSVRVTGDYKGDHAKLKEAVNKTIDNLDQALKQVSLSTEAVAAASQQISEGSQSLAEGSNEQAASLEEISSSLEEMSSMTKQNAENANQAKVLAGEANKSAASGQVEMNHMTDAINRIKESSDKTAEIVKTIDAIAMQTNLLALNAAVEAARAGEAGRGFAVVAEEVRNLAQRSAEAAKNTANMIAESVKNSEDGVQIASEVSKVFDSIASSNSKVDNLISEIAAASQEQSTGIDQINTAVAQLDKVTQQNAANSEESASAAEELNSQAEELQSMIKQFELSETSSDVFNVNSRHKLQIDAEKHQKKLSVSDQKKRLIGLEKNGSVKKITAKEIIPLDDNELAKF